MNILEINIYNSFCVLDNTTTYVIDNIKQLLTYKNDIEGEKSQLFNKVRYFKNIGNKALMGKTLARIKFLEDNEYVCWFDEEKSRFPTGHLNMIIDLLKVIAKDKYKIIDHREKPEAYNILPWVNKPHKMRYYQKEMFDLGMKSGRGVFESAVGSGKSLILINLVKALSVNTLIIVPSKGLLDQLYIDVKLYLGAGKVQQLDAAKIRKVVKLKPIRIMTVQSLAALNKKGEANLVLEDIDALFVDEIHHCLIPNTKIMTDSGIMTIKKIVESKFNGKVLSYNIETKQMEYKRVLDHFTYEAPNNLIEINYTEDSGTSRSLKCTKNHKIYTSNRGYVLAEKLTTSDDIIVDNGLSNKINNIKPIDNIENNRRINSKVYDIEVEDNHNYIANNLLVSNSAASSYTNLLESLDHVYYKYGFSGTYLRSDSKTLDMWGFLSNKLYSYGAKQATKDGYLTPTKLKVWELEGKRHKNYQKEYDLNYCGNKYMMGVIREIIVDNPKAQILILVNKKDKSGNLINLYLNALKIKNSYISGDNKKEVITKTISDFNDKKINVLIGSSVIGEGIDIRSTDHLIMAQGGKSEISIVQAIGRCVRLFEGKSEAFVHDFKFNNTYYLEKHLEKRLAIYENNFNPEIIE